MHEPNKAEYIYSLTEYNIDVSLFIGVLTSMVTGTIGFIAGLVINGLPGHPFEDMSLAWIWVPALIGYFIPLVLDIIHTNKINKPCKKRYALEMANYNEYVKQTQRNELETFIKECKS